MCLSLGVSLHTPTEGKNDGSVNGVRYFDCQPNFGIFLKSGMLHIERTDDDSISTRMMPSVAEAVSAPSRPVRKTALGSKAGPSTSAPKTSKDDTNRPSSRSGRNPSRRPSGTQSTTSTPKPTTTKVQKLKPGAVPSKSLKRSTSRSRLSKDDHTASSSSLLKKSGSKSSINATGPSGSNSSSMKKTTLTKKSSAGTLPRKTKPKAAPVRPGSGPKPERRKSGIAVPRQGSTRDVKSASLKVRPSNNGRPNNGTNGTTKKVTGRRLSKNGSVRSTGSASDHKPVLLKRRSEEEMTNDDGEKTPAHSSLEEIGGVIKSKTYVFI